MLTRAIEPTRWVGSSQDSFNEEAVMKLSRWVFASAGIWGLAVVPPLFFLFDTIGRQDPPAITQPEFYYGFACVTVAWQLAFLVIASNPARYRLLMLPAIVEKVAWVGTLIVLHAQHRVSSSAIPFGAVDLLFGVLFAVAFFKTPA
jgi:hypothetical protein